MGASGLASGLRLGSALVEGQYFDLEGDNI